MAFKFSLAPVLEQRQATEDRAQREYGTAQQKLLRLRQQKREIDGEVQARKQQVREEQMQALPYARRELVENWIVALEQHLRQVEQDMYRQIAMVEQLRLKLVKAMQDRTIMEKLRDKEIEEYRQAEERSERRRFDEIAIRNFAMAQRQAKFAESQVPQAERIAG
jgi:flagellar FliJ protein